ncbi:MAG TPA: AraC family ligand binding domain-containing protein [Verrucomicrobiae bacterium]|nr:AraC family ligand binding domain-containing protein [Verrucomicrobiae bacterium]
MFEYLLDDSDINGAVGVINGRYPESGWAINEKCKELVYIISGEGVLGVREQKQELRSGDLALILPGEEYYFEGKDLTIFMPCTPAWYPEQHREVSF